MNEKLQVHMLRGIDQKISVSVDVSFWVHLNSYLTIDRCSSLMGGSYMFISIGGFFLN